MGGAISVVDYQCSRSEPVVSSVTIRDSVFDRCTSGQRGGAIYTSSGATEIDNSIFLSCSAKVSGGSIFASEGGAEVSLRVSGSLFNGSSAQESGGGVLHAQNARTVLSGCRCTRNTAVQGGGGVVLWEGLESIFVCGLGTFTSDSQNFQCELCESGKYQSGMGMLDSSACLLCDAGTVSVEGASSCAYCAAGKYSSLIGRRSAQCDDCAEGAYQTGLGMPAMGNCTACPAGTFSQYNGSQSCSLCKPGKFSTEVGSVSNTCNGICVAGSYSQAGASTCTDCESGTYSTGKATNVFLVHLTKTYWLVGFSPGGHFTFYMFTLSAWKDLCSHCFN